MQETRSVLYVVWLHWAVQLAIGVVAAGALLAVIGALVEAVRAGEAAEAAPAIAGMVLLAGIVLVLAASTVFRLYRVEGDAAGLVARRWGGETSVAWTDVVEVGRPGWAANPAFPVARVRTKGGATLDFFAGSDERDRLDALRRNQR